MDDMDGNRTLSGTNGSCLAYRLHHTFVESRFDYHETGVLSGELAGELVALHIVPYLVILTGCAIGATGYAILRPAVVVVGFCAGSVSALHLFYRYSTVLHDEWGCDMVVAASLSLGGVLGLVGVMCANAVSVILGGVAGGSACALMFDMCAPCNGALWPDAPMLLGRSLVPFWLSLATCVGVGGYVCRRQNKRVLALVTSVVGGWGTAVGVRLAVRAQRAALPSWAGLLIACCVGGVGFLIQLRIMRRRHRPARARTSAR